MQSTARIGSESPSSASQPIRVMVVDDSAIVRGLVTRWLGEASDIEVVSTQRNGQKALDALAAADPEVIILDIEMPEMDGMTALPQILRQKPNIAVIMASTLTRRNAEISLKALSLGARDYIPKPEAQHGMVTADDFRRDLLDKVRALAPRRRTAPGSAPRAVSAGRTAPAKPSPAIPSGPISLRNPSSVRPRVLLIGSSTGGPPALTAVLEAFGKTPVSVPILITQHMPPTFTGILAEHLARASGLPAAEGQHGEPISPGRIYVAPGGRHMLIEGGTVPSIRLDDSPPVNYCKPAVDPLFESGAKAYGAATLALVLTGMGHDGAEGSRAVAATGGTVVAQDEASSVVWGMPGATARAGVCSAVLPLDRIPGQIANYLKGIKA
jgi:two-component system, chemotaxis family, protein-glutamate methylesterase/glutaminase